MFSLLFASYMLQCAVLTICLVSLPLRFVLGSRLLLADRS